MPLCRQNLHERCNLSGRHRWDIESGILVEKHHGYQYEHIFCYDWNAMMGYHYLMRLTHLINVLAIYSERLLKMVRELGVRGFIRFIRDTISGPWLDPVLIQKRLVAPFQLRLIKASKKHNKIQQNALQIMMGKAILCSNVDIFCRKQGN